MAYGVEFMLVRGDIVVDVQPGCYETCDPNGLAEVILQREVAGYALDRAANTDEHLSPFAEAKVIVQCPGRQRSLPLSGGRCALTGICEVTEIKMGVEAPIDPVDDVPPAPDQPGHTV